MTTYDNQTHSALRIASRTWLINSFMVLVLALCVISPTEGSAATPRFVSSFLWSETGQYPRAISTADLNGDGILDLVTADEGSNSVSILLGAASGFFQAPRKIYPTGSAPRAVANPPV